MDLQRIVWAWEPVLALLAEDDPVLGVVIGAGCRPIAADRYPDGRVLLVLGCCIAPFVRSLRTDPLNERATQKLGALLGESLNLSVVNWPVGRVDLDSPEGSAVRQAMARAERGELASPPVLSFPSPLDADRLDDDLKSQLAKCESVLQRMMFAELLSRGLRPECQYRVGAFRVDFAFPSARVAADIEGWEPAAGRHRQGGSQERDEEIKSRGWTTLRFSGREVYEDVARCANAVRQAAQRRKTDRARFER